jgi:hypothetical protein
MIKSKSYRLSLGFLVILHRVSICLNFSTHILKCFPMTRLNLLAGHNDFFLTYKLHILSSINCYVNSRWASLSRTNHITSFKVYKWLVTEHLCSFHCSSHINKTCSCFVIWIFNYTSMFCFSNMDNKKCKLTSKDESAAKKW